jgi:predicted site-specific integrase-resolvase
MALKLVPLQVAASRLGLTPSQIYRLAVSQQIKAQRQENGRWLVPESEVRRLAAHPSPSRVA